MTTTASQNRTHARSREFRARRDWALAASDLMRAVSLDYPVDAVITRVAGHARDLLGLDMCAVLLADETSGELRVAGSAGLSQQYITRLHSEHPLRVTQAGKEPPSPSVEAFLAQDTVVVPDIGLSDGMAEWRLLALDEGYRALIATPLIEAERTTGVLVGYSRRTRDFPGDVVDLLAMFAVHAASSILAVRRRDELQQAVTDLKAANQELRQHRNRLESIDVHHRQLMQVLANDVGVLGIATMLAELLDSSVTVGDLSGRVIAFASRGTYVPPPMLFDEHSLKRAGLLGRLAAGHGAALRVPEEGAEPCTSWVTGVTLNREVVATVWVGRPDHELDEMGRLTVESFAMGIALALSKQRSALQMRMQISRDLLSELVSEIRDVDRLPLIERASALGHDLSKSVRLIVARLDPTDTLPRHSILDVAHAVIRQRGNGELVGEVNGQAVVILDAGTGDLGSDLAAALVAEFKRRNPGHSASAYLTGTIADVTDLARHHRIARNALDLMGHGRRDAVVESHELGTEFIVLSHGDPDGLREFANRVFAPLADLAPSRLDELLETVQVWLECAFSTSAAAERLHVHPNTVSYRIKSFEQRIGRSPRDPGLLTDLNLALAIKRVMGDLALRDRVLGRDTRISF